LIVDVEDPKDLDTRRLKIVGGGTIAEVKTVLETLEPVSPSGQKGEER
jgi:hypothetical protein